MTIRVTCPGCRTRFSVSDQYAGRKGPCPKCKAQITIPTKGEEVVVHAPDEFAGGGRDTQGRLVLKPIERDDLRFTLPLVAGLAAGALLLILAAWALGRAYGDSGPPVMIVALGSLLVAAPVGWAAYLFLRDQDLAPFRGLALWLRLGGCGAIYAAIWGAYALFRAKMLGGSAPETWHLLFVGAPLVALGGGAAMILLELDYTSALMHYCFYLGATIALAWLMGLPPY